MYSRRWRRRSAFPKCAGKSDERASDERSSDNGDFPKCDGNSDERDGDSDRGVVKHGSQLIFAIYRPAEYDGDAVQYSSEFFSEAAAARDGRWSGGVCPSDSRSVRPIYRKGHSRAKACARCWRRR